MQVEDLRYYYDSFFSERTKEQFEEVILVVSKITESISQLDTCNALFEAKGAINSVGLEKITSEALSDYKKQISNIKESIESDVKKLKRLKRRLPFRIDYSLYKEMKEEMDKAMELHKALVEAAAEHDDVLMEKFDSPIWEELYKPCLACGTCTFVCPTCQCYDIKDYNTGNGVQRYRCWDSCMYSDFTMMAHGNNRTSQMQRFRQRFMHKLVYFPANNDGMYSCVGCGRCVEKCPSALNIVKVIKAFQNQGGEN